MNSIYDFFVNTTTEQPTTIITTPKPIINLACHARDKILTIQDIQNATILQLQQDKTDYNSTTLYEACENCSVEIVEAILDKGVDIDGFTIVGLQWTALMNAALNRKWDIVTLLIKRGANAQLVNTEYNRNALHYACQEGAPEYIIELLIQAGADPQVKSNRGETPADLANYRGHTAIASYVEQYYKPTKSANLIV
jgi:ankyrin repeat protein